MGPINALPKLFLGLDRWFPYSPLIKTAARRKKTDFSVRDCLKGCEIVFSRIESGGGILSGYREQKHTLRRFKKSDLILRMS